MLFFIFVLFLIAYFLIEFEYYIPRKIEEYENRNVPYDWYTIRIDKKISIINSCIFLAITFVALWFDEPQIFRPIAVISAIIFILNFIVFGWTIGKEYEKRVKSGFSWEKYKN